MTTSLPQSPVDDKQPFSFNLQHSHKDLVQAIAFNTYGDRCATGSVDGKIRVFNRHKDGTWRLCDTWTAHGGEVLEVQTLPTIISHRPLTSHSSNGSLRPYTPTLLRRSAWKAGSASGPRTLQQLLAGASAQDARLTAVQPSTRARPARRTAPFR